MRRKLEGSKRQDGTWRIVVVLTDENGGKHRKYIEAATQRECQRRAKELLARHEDRRPSANMRLADFLEKALEQRFEPRCSPKTVVLYRAILKNWIAPTIGNVALDQLKPRHVETAMAAAADEGHPRTANIVRQFIRTSLNWAMKQDLVDRNAASLADPIQCRPRLQPMLLQGDLARILAAEPNRVRRALWTTLAETGLRPTEALTLTWDHLVCVEGEWLVHLAESKTAAGQRPVPIDKDLVRMLREIRRKDTDLVFATENGTRLTYRNVSRDWHLAIERANRASQPGDEIQDTNLYQLRKLFGREMARVAPDHVLKRLMRHTHISTTKQFYVDAEMQEMREAIGKKRTKHTGGETGGGNE